MLMSAEETQTDRHADRCIRRTVYILGKEKVMPPHLEAKKKQHTRIRHAANVYLTHYLFEIKSTNR